MRQSLRTQGIDTGIHYPTPPHLQGAYADAGFGVGSFPLSERIHAEVLSLPIGPHLTETDVDTVIRAVRVFNAQASTDL
jgi:dTDP-4-amino-4,6-dideoxygalactose transaminase